jgi:hypothetical protein
MCPYFFLTELMSLSQAITHDLDAVMLQLPVQSVGTLPQTHDVRHLIRMILTLADQATERQRTPMLMSQKIVQLLYKTPSPLGREVYTHILEQLCATFEEVSREARTWLEYAEDEVKILLLSRKCESDLVTAKIQCSSYRSVTSFWPDQAGDSRYSIGQEFVPGPTTESTSLRGRFNSRVFVRRKSNCKPI